MSDEQSMVERVARAMKAKLSADESDVYFRDDGGTCLVDGHVDMDALARAAIEAMKDPPFDILGAVFEAMFEDKWNGSQAPMIGAGWDAGIDAALTEHANAR